MAPYYEPGEYWGQVQSQQFGETSNGNPQFVLTVLVYASVDPSAPDKTYDCIQNERSIFRTITDKTAEWFWQDMDALGYQGDSFSGLDPDNPQHHSFVGQSILVRCEHEEYNGKMRERWSIGGRRALSVKPVEQGALRKLDALFGRKKAGGPAPAPAPARAPQAQSQAQPRPQIMLGPVPTSQRQAPPMQAPADDDLPF